VLRCGWSDSDRRYVLSTSTKGNEEDVRICHVEAVIVFQSAKSVNPLASKGAVTPVRRHAISSRD
jgi:hypothetical protein